jgi:two-component system, response regulator PdtaR
VCHVLIIEDDILIALHLQTLLEENGATSVDIADTETKAIKAAAANPPAVITSDVSLAAGTGLAAVQATHEEHGAIPVIFVTGRPETCRRCGPQARVRVFGKPVDEVALARAFRELRPA